MSATSTPPSSRTVEPSHLLQLLILGAVWGGAYLAMRIAAPDVGAVWAAEARTTIAAIVLVAIAGRRTWTVARSNPGAFLVAGIAFSAVPFTLIAFATLTLPAGFAAILNSSTPLFTALLSVTMLGQRLAPRVVAGIAAGIVAVVVLVGWSPIAPGLATLLAVLAALGAALSYAFAGTFVRRRLPDVGGIEMATGQLVVAAIVLLPLAVLVGGNAPSSPDTVLALLALGLLSTALPWPIYLRLLRQTTPTVASTVTFIVPTFAAIWAAVVLGEPIGPNLVVGFALVALSLTLVLGLRPRFAVPSLAGLRDARAGRAAARA